MQTTKKKVPSNQVNIRLRSGLMETYEVDARVTLFIREEAVLADPTPLPDAYELDPKRSVLRYDSKKNRNTRVWVFNEGNPIALDFDVPVVGLDAIKVALLAGPLVPKIIAMGLTSRGAKKNLLDQKWLIMGAIVLVIIAVVASHYLWPASTVAPLPTHGTIPSQPTSNPTGGSF